MPIEGDIEFPDGWIAALPQIDAVIHMACDFKTAMARIDRKLLDALLPALAAQHTRVRLIYTGGCWLFGAGGDDLVTEQTPFRPLPAFAWMVQSVERVLAFAQIDGIVIHPAMVYEPTAGVFLRFFTEAADRDRVRVVGSEAVRWPLVHSEDLADLYVSALERAPAGSSYIGAPVEGLAVGRIARAFADRFNTPNRVPEEVAPDAIAAELGEWARGYAWDQRLSGAKARRELGWQPRHLDPEGEIRCLSGRSVDTN
jgi:nucleoside-diphosphate-sugar epimerase